MGGNFTLNKYVKNNLIIGICVFFALVLGLICTFAYSDVDKNVYKLTDVVEGYDHREKRWSDYIGNNSGTPYFHIDLAEKGFFKATGIAYDNIDKTLFLVLQTGKEITIIYNDSRYILGIEYEGITYLDYDAVVAEFDSCAKISMVIGPILMKVTIVAGVVVWYFNFKKNKISVKNASSND